MQAGERLSMPTKADILRQLSIGSRVAEDEVDELSRYFVETDQWRRILAGEVDVVFGPKGSGKSAIYTSLVSRVDDLFDRRIVIVPGENPRGTPAFALSLSPRRPSRSSSAFGSSMYSVFSTKCLSLGASATTGLAEFDNR
jgi:hypothetical protein